MSTETNFCRTCQQDKPLSEFYLCRGYVENRCKTCKNKTRTRNRSLCKVQGCGSQVYKFGLCVDHASEASDPTPAQIEAMKRQIRAENGHDPKQPRLFAAPRS